MFIPCFFPEIETGSLDTLVILGVTNLVGDVAGEDTSEFDGCPFLRLELSGSDNSSKCSSIN